MTKSTIPTNTSDCTPPRPLPMESRTSKKLRQSRETPKNETGVVLDPGGRPAPYEVGVGAGLLDILLTDKTRNTTLSRPNRSVEHGHHSPSAAIPPPPSFPHTPTSFPRRREPRGAVRSVASLSLDGCFAQLPSFPRRRESRGVRQTGTRGPFGLVTAPTSSCAKVPRRERARACPGLEPGVRVNRAPKGT